MEISSLDSTEVQNVDVITMMHQKNQFLLLVEELRFCRNTRKNMDMSIENLKSEKTKLESEITSLISKNQKLSKCCQELEEKLFSTCKVSSLQNCNEENRKLTLALEASETTMNDLKKEVGLYKSTISDFEKKLAESEQKCIVAQQSSSVYCEKVELFHKIVEKINKRLEQLADTQLRLDRNVEAVTSLNIQYCSIQKNLEQVIIQLKSEKEELKKQIISLKSKLIADSIGNNIMTTQTLLKEQNRNLLIEKDVLKDLNLSLATELNENKKQLKEANASLKRLYELLNRDTVINKQTHSNLQEITVKTEKREEDLLMQLNQCNAE